MCTCEAKNKIRRGKCLSGVELLELLNKSPEGTVPVIISRLKQKDKLLRGLRSELSQRWAPRQGMTNRAPPRYRDGKNTTPRHLVQELIAKAGPAKPFTLPGTSKLQYSLMHRSLMDLIIASIDQSAMSQQEIRKTKLACSVFLAPFFGVTPPPGSQKIKKSHASEHVLLELSLVCSVLN